MSVQTQEIDECRVKSYLMAQIHAELESWTAGELLNLAMRVAFERELLGMPFGIVKKGTK